MKIDEMRVTMELEPCPWCGTTPVLHKSCFNRVIEAYAIYCPNTNCAVKPTTRYEPLAIVVEHWNSWNRRVNNG